MQLKDKSTPGKSSYNQKVSSSFAKKRSEGLQANTNTMSPVDQKMGQRKDSDTAFVLINGKLETLNS